MRLFTINLLASALLVFGASSAGAISLTVAGVAPIDLAASTEVAQGDTFEVTMTLDTEATLGITLMSIGVLFDDTQLEYNKDLSTTTSYILFGSGKGGGGYMNALATCGGGFGAPDAGSGCSLRVNTTNQVNVDYVSTDLSNGTANTTADIYPPDNVVQLVTLSFTVLAEAAGGPAHITLSQTSPGNVIGQPGGTSTTGTLLGSGSVTVPEPGLAGLSLAALLTLGGLRIRARRR